MLFVICVCLVVRVWLLLIRRYSALFCSDVALFWLLLGYEVWFD